MDNFLRIDMHVHTSGVSTCARQTVEQTIDQKIKEGYDGMVITNHCQPWYYPPTVAFQERYVQSALDEYARAVEYGKQKNFRVYLGLEVTLFNPFYSDWLLYGVSEEFLRQAPVLYMLSQRELFALCQEYGVVLIQAHPFRPIPYRGIVHGVAEIKYLHGIEINCSEKDTKHKAAILERIEQDNLLAACGTDYHGKPERPFVVGGAYIPKSVETCKQFAEYLLKEKQIRLFFGNEEIFIKK